MTYIEALNAYNTDNTVCILVEAKEGLRALTEHNFSGGCCGCCKGFENDDSLIVKRVVDMETMEVFYDINKGDI